MKKKRCLALTLAGLLCVGLLSACGSDTGNESGTEEPPLESASATPTPEDSSTGETGGLVETPSYSAGMVLSVDGSQLTLQCYTPADGSSEAVLTNATDFILSDYVLSQNIVTITVDDESLLHRLEDSTGGSLAVSDLMPGNILLWQQDADTGALTDVVLQNTGAAAEIQLAQVTSIGEDGSLTVTWYTPADTTDSVTSYTNIDLSAYTLDSSAEELAVDESISVYLLEDTYLTEGALSDLSVGDTLAVSLSSDGQPVQMVLIPASEPLNAI